MLKQHTIGKTFMLWFPSRDKTLSPRKVAITADNNTNKIIE